MMGALRGWWKPRRPRRRSAPVVSVSVGCFVVVVVVVACCWLWDVRSASAYRATTTTTTTTTRRVVSFDFGWKHRAGLHDWPNDPYEPPINTTTATGGRGCVDPGDGPAEASESYNGTSDWIDVDLPHDGIISNPFGNAPSLRACPDGCSGRSYVPRHVLWYRKRFRLPTTADRIDIDIDDDGDDDGSTTPSTSSSLSSSSSWQDELLEGTSRIYLRFDGSFRNTTVYLNGRRVVTHECGYTPFRIELTPATLGLLGVASPGDVASVIGTDTVHTIAVFVDPDNGDRGGPSRGSGWWYEGGGLYRHAWLEKVPRSGRVSHDGVFVTSDPEFVGHGRHQHHEHSPAAPSPGTVARASMELRATFEIEDGNEIYCHGFTVRETGIDENDEARRGTGRVVGSREARMRKTSLRPLNISSSSSESDGGVTIITVSERLVVADPKLWTSSNPHLYEVTSALYKGCGTGDDGDGDVGSGPILLDEASVHHGIRSTRFDPNTGFYWNEAPYKIRGFCDHDTFAVVGMAVPDRINLFRAQASRSIGGNARRASHNPPDPAALAIYDRLGMVVIDENRLFDNNTHYVHNMADLVRRDRNHPSVVLWSFCNEVGCEGDHESGGPAFQSVVAALDGSRPTLANMFTFHDLLSDTIDVQGFSHRHRDVLDQCHADLPDKPIVQSECCSCNTMRDVDEGCETTSDNPHTTCDQKAFNARCLQRLVNASDGTEYASGTFVWTLLDYYGEPPSRPLTVSSTYGQFDLCGFPKASAFWFRSQWLLTPPPRDDAAAPSRAIDHRRLRSNSDRTSGSESAVANGRPFDAEDLVEVHIVESWESPDRWNTTRGNTTRTIHAYSNAPVVELYFEGRDAGGSAPTSLGTRNLEPMVDGDAGTYGEWRAIPWNPGRITAVARSLGGTELARTARETNRPHPDVSLALTLDCPSPRTGTGSALLLDGSDAALIRGTIVDSATNQTLVFADHTVVFRVVAGPGRILGTANGDPKSKRSHTEAVHPAHHGLVRALVGVTSIAGRSDRDLVRSMRSDGSNPLSEEEGDIVVEATAAGLRPVRLTIPTSTDPGRASVLAVAAREAGRPVDLVMSSVFQPRERATDRPSFGTTTAAGHRARD